MKTWWRLKRLRISTELRVAWPRPRPQTVKRMRAISFPQQAVQLRKGADEFQAVDVQQGLDPGKVEAEPELLPLLGVGGKQGHEARHFLEFHQEVVGLRLRGRDRSE